MMNAKTLLVATSLWFCSVAITLAQPFKANPETAMQLFKAGEYNRALVHYSKLIETNSKDPKTNFYYGACLVETNQQLSMATRCLKYASLKGINKENLFYLGRAYQLNYEFEEALSTFAKLLKLPLIDAALKDRTMRCMDECKFGTSQTPKIFQVSVESADTVAPSGMLPLYSCSPELGKLLKNGEFFESGIDPLGILFVTERGDRVFYSSPNNGADDIFKMEKLMDGWSKPIAVGVAVNSPSDEKYPVLLTDGATLYFSSNRPGGMGGWDIYKATYNADTKEFGDVSNLGIPFNSPRDDYFFVPDEFSKTAWLSSNRSTVGDNLVVYKVAWDETVVKNSVSDINQVKDAANLLVDSNSVHKSGGQTTNGRTNAAKLSDVSFRFSIADTLEYTQYEHFRSSEALSEFKKGRMLEQKKDSLGLLMKEKRARYATTNSDAERNAMVNDILRLEKETYSIDAAIGSQYSNAQRLEQDKIANLVRTGQYASQEGTKVEAKSMVTFNVSDIPHDITLYSEDEFGRQLKALQGIYPRLYDSSKTFQLQQADSLYVWANLLNIESSRLLEKAAKSPSVQEIPVPNLFKQQNNASTTGVDMVKQAKELKDRSLILYHQSLDVKYAIYRNKYEEINGLSILGDQKPQVMRYSDEAYAFNKEAAELTEQAKLSANQETYEKAGTLKRKAVEAQEKGLFLYLEMLDGKVPEKAEKQSVTNGFAKPSYSEIHRAEGEPQLVTTLPKTAKVETRSEEEVVPVAEKPHVSKPVTTAVIYKIQIGVFKNKPNDASLKNLESVSSDYLAESGLTKYFCGQYVSYDQANANLQKVREAGFPGAFVVGFLNGKQVPVQQAREVEQKKQ